MPAFGFFRFDGPTAVEPRGPTEYCVGNDPDLDAVAISASCSTPLALQWYADGVPVTGATGPTWRPAFAAGDHTVDVRGTCSSEPTCTPDALSVALRAVAAQAPIDVGNKLMAVRTAANEAALDWSLAPPAPGSHGHVYRSAAKATPRTRISADPWATESYIDTPPGPLALYDVRRADLCEAESAGFR